jgi:hypothetical protein
MNRCALLRLYKQVERWRWLFWLLFNFAWRVAVWKSKKSHCSLRCYYSVEWNYERQEEKLLRLLETQVGWCRTTCKELYLQSEVRNCSRNTATYGKPRSVSLRYLRKGGGGGGGEEFCRVCSIGALFRWQWMCTISRLDCSDNVAAVGVVWWERAVEQYLQSKAAITTLVYKTPRL